MGDLPRNGGGDNTNPGIDAGTTPGIDAAPIGNGCVNRITAVDPAHVHAVGGTNAGVGCVVAGCHLANNPGAGAPGFQFAGTVYKPGGGKIPSAGATVRVKSAGGVETAAITDDAGNFHIAAGSLMNAFPATVNVTACPNVTPMVSTLAQGGGNCMSAGCHAGAAAGAAGPITLAD